MRSAVGNDERFRCCDHVHGSGRGAESGDGDVDGNVSERRNEVGIRDDHDHIGRGQQRECDDFAEGDGIGAKSVARADGDADE